MDPLILLFLIVSLSWTISCQSPSVPIVPPEYASQMRVFLNTTLSNPPQVFQWNMTQYYSMTLMSSRIEHTRGQYDEACIGVKGHETTQEPCIEIINPQWRYIWLPESNICCRRCSSVGPFNCGIVRNNWAQNGNYVGLAKINMGNGNFEICEEFEVLGAEVNHFYVTPKYAPKGYVTPCQFWETKNGRVPIKQITYQLAGWAVPGNQNASLYQLPANLNCDQDCSQVSE